MWSLKAYVSSELSSFSNETTALTAIEQSFIMPRGINVIATTSTSYGITIKDIIGMLRAHMHMTRPLTVPALTVANENNQVQSFPRRILDPRRPMRKPTAEEMEEWLIQYDPIIYDDPKRVLSHRYEVRSTSQLRTTVFLLSTMIRWSEQSTSSPLLHYLSPRPSSSLTATTSSSRG